MKWLMIYLICAIATAIFFGYIAKHDDEEVFKRDRVIAILSMCIIGASFPIVWVAAVAIVARAQRNRRRTGRALEFIDKAYSAAEILDVKDYIRERRKETINGKTDN